MSTLARRIVELSALYNAKALGPVEHCQAHKVLFYLAQHVISGNYTCS